MWSHIAGGLKIKVTYRKLPFRTKSRSLIIKGGLKIEGCKIEGLLYIDQAYFIHMHIIMIICSSYIALYPQTSSKHFTYHYPGTPVHTNTSAEHQSTQAGCTLRGSTGDQRTRAFSVYCQVLIYGRVNRSTFRVQVLPRDSRY